MILLGSNGGLHAATQGFSPLSGDQIGAVTSGTFLEDEEHFKTFGDINLVVGPEVSEGLGTVTVTTRRVIWISQEDQSCGFAVGYRAIMVHAVSRDPEAYDKPCIFVQLDSDFDEANEEDEEVEEDAPEFVSELRLAPVDPDHLDPMFQAMSDCAAMNPDSDVDDDEGEFFYNEDEVMAGVDPERREAMMDHFDSLLEPPPGDDLQELIADDPDRFDDAEEDD